MKNTYNFLDVSLSSLGVALGVNNIQDFLGLLLLIVSLLNIAFKLLNSIIRKIKNKDILSIEEDLEKARQEIEALKNKEDWLMIIKEKTISFYLQFLKDTPTSELDAPTITMLLQAFRGYLLNSVDELNAQLVSDVASAIEELTPVLESKIATAKSEAISTATASADTTATAKLNEAKGELNTSIGEVAEDLSSYKTTSAQRFSTEEIYLDDINTNTGDEIRVHNTINIDNSDIKGVHAVYTDFIAPTSEDKELGVSGDVNMYSYALKGVGGLTMNSQIDMNTNDIIDAETIQVNDTLKVNYIEDNSGNRIINADERTINSEYIYNTEIIESNEVYAIDQIKIGNTYCTEDDLITAKKHLYLHSIYLYGNDEDDSSYYINLSIYLDNNNVIDNFTKLYQYIINNGCLLSGERYITANGYSDTGNYEVIYSLSAYTDNQKIILHTHRDSTPEIKSIDLIIDNTTQIL